MPESQTVLVTGASGAIGSATVRAFLSRGCSVLGLDRQPTGSDAPTSIAYIHRVLDLADSDPVERELADALRDMPPLAHVAGIAGGALPDEPRTRDDIEAITPELFRASLDANLTTQFIVTRAALPHLQTQGPQNRSITLTSSFNALSAQGMPAYSAAKAGIAGMMFGLARPLGRLGIRINVVAAGTVRTPRTEAIWGGVPEHFARLEKTTLLGRLGAPDDIAAAFVSLALDLQHVAGHVLVVDGGQLLNS